MASLRSLYSVHSRNLSAVLRRQVLVNRPASTLVSINPVPTIRPEASGLESLKNKEQGPWNQLSKEEKVELYRAQFPLTMAEQAAETGPSGQKVFGLTLLLSSIGIIYFLFLRKYVGPEAPRSLTDEWAAASIEKMKKQRINPILGVSAEK